MTEAEFKALQPGDKLKYKCPEDGVWVAVETYLGITAEGLWHVAAGHGTNFYWYRQEMLDLYHIPTPLFMILYG